MGEIAALITSFCWAMSSIFFSFASDSIGSLNVNRIRLIFAVLFIGLTNLFLTGQLLPLQADIQSWFWLGLSGIVGLVIGDTLLFQSYVMLGVRLGTLLMASTPVMSTLIAWIFLAEHLSPYKLAGILITVAGIAIVVLERRQNGTHPKGAKWFILGILAGIGGAAGQASGLVLAKYGLKPEIPAYSGVLIRMLIALVVLWAMTMLTGKARQTIKSASSNRRALGSIAVGSFVGPFIGVWLSLVSIRSTYVGVASTLMALAPVILLPVMKWGYKEEVTIRAIAGTFLAMIGVAVIFLVN